jgi:hypothetical protein
MVWRYPNFRKPLHGRLWDVMGNIFTGKPWKEPSKMATKIRLWIDALSSTMIFDLMEFCGEHLHRKP